MLQSHQEVFLPISNFSGAVASSAGAPVAATAAAAQAPEAKKEEKKEEEADVDMGGLFGDDY